jgi:DNA-binding response OmpR family regulator
MRLLVVEDDDGIAEPLVAGLRREGFEVERVATGAAALAAPEPDLVLLDLRLPDIDGYAVAREMRARSRVPIIMVTAKGEEVDRVIGLELGADDYVVKPFGLRELVARIHAVTRRAAGAPEPDPVTAIGPLAIDRRRRAVTLDGEELPEVWGTRWYGPSKTIDVHVSALRRKLGDPGWIETVRGVGFRLRSP